MNILVPVDFSPNSKNAAQYALDFGKCLWPDDCKITFINCYKVKSSSGMFFTVEKFMRDEAEKEMADLYNKIEDQLTEGFQVETKCVRGNEVPTIALYANKPEFDFLIMGTQGSSGLKEVFLGSVSSGVMKQSEKPIIAVSEDSIFQRIERMIVAVDSDGISNKKSIEILLKISKKFDSELFILHISKETNQNLEESVMPLFEGHNAVFIHAQGDDVNRIINDYVLMEEAQMICMFHRQRGFLDSLFQASVTKRSIFSATVPLLVIPK